MTRPSKLHKIDESLIKALASYGLTDSEMSKAFGVSVVTWWSWKHRSAKFLKALNDGKEIADKRVEKTLFERAIGYTAPDEKLFCDKGKVVRAKTFKHYPGDVTAQIFWLKNRRPDEWRENNGPLIDQSTHYHCTIKKLHEGINSPTDDLRVDRGVAEKAANLLS